MIEVPKCLLVRSCSQKENPHTEQRAAYPAPSGQYGWVTCRKLHIYCKYQTQSPQLSTQFCLGISWSKLSNNLNLRGKKIKMEGKGLFLFLGHQKILNCWSGWSMKKEKQIQTMTNKACCAWVTNWIKQDLWKQEEKHLGATSQLSNEPCHLLVSLLNYFNSLMESRRREVSRFKTLPLPYQECLSDLEEQCRNDFLRCEHENSAGFFNLGDDSFPNCVLGIMLTYFLKEGLTLQRGKVIVLQISLLWTGKGLYL